MFASILFALVIESQSIGDFFTLPSGIPTSNIWSTYTPGSDSFNSNTWRRLNVNAQAAYLSTFEAYYERLYYTSMNNGYNTPATADFGSTGIFVFHPTNRVYSRRVNDYDNTKWLLHHMRSNWRNLYDHHQYAPSLIGNHYWSTSERIPLKVEGATTYYNNYNLAEHNWDVLANYGINSNECLITFQNFDGGGVFNGTNEHHSVLFDIFSRMGVMRTSEYEFLTNRVSFSLPYMLTDSYNETSISSMTNLHRRFDNAAKAISPANQVLRMMDVVIHKPVLEVWPAEYTQTEYLRGVQDVGEITVNISYDASGAHIPQLTTSDIIWHLQTISNDVERSVQRYEQRYLSVTPGVFNGDNQLYIASNGLLASYDLTCDMIANALQAAGAGSGNYAIYIPSSPDGTVAFNIEGKVGVFMNLPAQQLDGQWPWRGDITVCPPDEVWTSPTNTSRVHYFTPYANQRYSVTHNLDGDNSYELNYGYGTIPMAESTDRSDEYEVVVLSSVAMTNGYDGLSLSNSNALRYTQTKCHINEEMRGKEHWEFNQLLADASDGISSKLRIAAMSDMRADYKNPSQIISVEQLREWAHNAGVFTILKNDFKGSLRMSEQTILGIFTKGVTPSFRENHPGDNVLPVSDALLANHRCIYERPRTSYTNFINKAWSGYGASDLYLWTKWKWKTLAAPAN